MDNRDFERQAWNDALASGDPERIKRAQDAILGATFTRIMNDDDEYTDAGWVTVNGIRYAIGDFDR